MPSNKRPVSRPASTDANRERQLSAIAYDLAEKQLLDGTASAQTINHFLKAGSSREKLEHQKLEKDNQLLKAKVEALESAKRVEELYAEALRAMRTYAGQDEEEVDSEELDLYDY